MIKVNMSLDFWPNARETVSCQSCLSPGLKTSLFQRSNIYNYLVWVVVTLHCWAWFPPAPEHKWCLSRNLLVLSLARAFSLGSGGNGYSSCEWLISYPQLWPCDNKDVFKMQSVSPASSLKSAQVSVSVLYTVWVSILSILRQACGKKKNKYRKVFLGVCGLQSDRDGVALKWDLEEMWF